MDNSYRGNLGGTYRNNCNYAATTLRIPELGNSAAVTPELNSGLPVAQNFLVYNNTPENSIEQSVMLLCYVYDVAYGQPASFNSLIDGNGCQTSQKNTIFAILIYAIRRVCGLLVCVYNYLMYLFDNSSVVSGLLMISLEHLLFQEQFLRM